MTFGGDGLARRAMSMRQLRLGVMAAVLEVCTRHKKLVWRASPLAGFQVTLEASGQAACAQGWESVV